MVFDLQEVVTTSQFKLQSSGIQGKFDLPSLRSFRRLIFEVDDNLHVLRVFRSFCLQFFRALILLSNPRCPQDEWEGLYIYRESRWALGGLGPICLLGGLRPGPICLLGLGLDPSACWAWAWTCFLDRLRLGPICSMGLGLDPFAWWARTRPTYLRKLGSIISLAQFFLGPWTRLGMRKLDYLNPIKL